MRRIALLLAVAVLAACSSGDDTDSGDPASPYVEALSGVFTSGESGPELEEDMADCIATAIVEIASVPALTAADVSPQELADSGDLEELGLQIPTDAAATLAADFAECDLGGAVVDSFVRAFADESGGDLSDAEVECVVEATPADDVEAALAATFVSADEGAGAFDAVMAGMASCPDAVTQLLINGFETANGEDVDLTEAAKACLAEQVEADPAWAASSFSTAEVEEGVEAFGTHLAEACPALSA